MPALSTNKEYTLSFNYSVTSSSGTPNLYKAIIMPKSAFTNQYCWNGFGAMMSGRGFLGAYDIFVNKALASTELSGTVTYTFNSKTQSEYYLFLTFNNIDTVTYSNFKVVDPTDTTPEPEENPAELWTNMSADDWHTKHIQGSAAYDDGRDIPEKTVAERYGSDFSFDTESKSFNLKNASGRHYYVKMPILAKNKEYTLSFDYNVVANGTPKIDKILLVPKDAFTHALCWQNTTGQIFTNRTNIGIKDMFVGVSIADKTSDTLTYEFNTGNYTEYYVFLKFSGISEITLSKFSVIDPDLVVDDEPDNPGNNPGDEPVPDIEIKPEDEADLWTEYSADDWYTKQIHTPNTDHLSIPERKMTDAYPDKFTYSNGRFSLTSAGSKHYYVKLPALTANKEYKLSFDYSVTSSSGTPTLHKALLAPQSVFSQNICWNDYGEMMSSRSNYGIYDIHVNKTLSETELSGTITYTFTTTTETQYYLFLSFKNIDAISYANFSVIDPTLQEDYEGSPLNYGSISPAELSEDAKAGDVIEFTATPFKGNSFVGWYDQNGTLLSESRTFSYTLTTSLAMPKPVFKAGDIEIENASLEDSEKGLLAYYNKDANFEKTIIDENYDVEYIGTPSWAVNIQAHNQHARTGKMSIKIQTQYAYSGRHISGLEKNTDYAISFWAYIQDDSGLSLNAMVLPKGVKPYKENSAGNLADYPANEAMGYSTKAATATSSWQEVIVRFNSGENTDITLWFLSRGANSDRCWVDDIAIFKPANLDVVGELGGSVSTTDSGTLAKGTEVTVTATPDKGNNFKHWLDKDGLVVSSDAEYTFTLEEDTYLKAVFGGYNKPARDLFALRGDDGTFENGTISGIYAASDVYPTSLGHCKTSVSTAYAYEGEKSLEVVSYYRNTVIPLTGLNKNTDYRFAFYIKYPYNGTQEDWNHISSMMICGADDVDTSTADKIFAEYSTYLAGDAGWYKVELYFNSGDNTAANFLIYYGGEPQLAPKVYMDNITLYEYYSANELLNGSMTGDIAPWLGDGEIENNTLKLSGESTTAYQLLGLDAHSRYTIKFRAKGNIFASASNVTAKVPDIYNALSPASYVEGNSSGFKNYSFEVYTGVHKGTAIMFSSLGGDAFIDDVTVTKELSAIGGVIENVDFETDRFALTHTNKDAYEIYTAKSNKDDNVHSGKKSLHFKYNSKNDVEQILDEAYLSYGVALNHNYMLSLYYKFDSDTKEAAVNLEPNYRATYFNGDYGDYTGEIGYKQPSTKGEWKRINFVFTARDFGVLKAAIYNIVGSTDNGFYIDDIVITVASDLVVDENA